MATINNTLNNSENQEPTGPDSDPQGHKSDIPNPDPPNFSPLLPNLSSLTPGDESIGNAQILLLGSLAINTLLTGSPAPESYRVPELITAANWLWRWHLATAGAGSKEEFVEVMTFLLKE